MKERILPIRAYGFYRWPEEDRIVCVGDRVVVLDAETLETVHTFSRPKDPSSVYAGEKRFIVMSTVGKFVIYRLPDMVEERSFRLPDIENTDHGFLCDTANDQISAIATTRSGQRLFTIPIGDGTIRSEELPQSRSAENVTLHSLFWYDGAICRLQCERNVHGSGYYSTVLYQGGREVKRFDFEMTFAQQIDPAFYYDAQGIADFHTGRYWSFQDMGLGNAVVYGVSKTGKGFAVATGESVVFCDREFHVYDKIPARYASAYLETERYALIGTWEKIVVKPLKQEKAGQEGTA